MARRSLAEFVRQAWGVLNPGRPLQWFPFLTGICSCLEAVSRGEPWARRLLVTQPPNTLKSTIVSVCWPAWVWISVPQTRWLFAASDGPLATRDAVGMRDLILSNWYRDSFRPAWYLKSDQDQKTWFSTTAGGHRISYSVGARVVGRKGDVLVIDDANDAKKAMSGVDRQGVIDWFDFAFSGRITDERTSPVVSAGQRVHTGDLIGHLKRKGGWTELRLAEEFDPAKRCTTPVWSDPRTTAGEWLRPGRFGPAEKADRLKALGPLGYKSQHLQDPDESDGRHFKESDLRWYTRRGEFYVLQTKSGPKEFLVRGRPTFCTVDPAASSSERADHTVISTWCVSPWADLVWLGCERFQADIPDILPRLAQVVKRWRPGFVGIEAVASNRAVFQLAERYRDVTIPARPLDPAGRDKLVRASVSIVLVNAGRVYLPTEEADPLFPSEQVVSELVLFTGTGGPDQQDDIVDTLAWAGLTMDWNPAVNTKDALPWVMGV
jgi:phage terminase large subunit-like protein